MDVLIVRDPEAVARHAASAVVAGLRRTAHPELVLGLATGSSPLGLYRELGRLVRAGELDLSTTSAFALDEYVGLPPGHPQSYRRVLEGVCQQLGLPVERLHVPDGSETGPEALERAAAAYEQELRAAGGVDVEVLGIGANGHVGFNEPGSSLASRTRVKRLSDRTRRDNARFFGRCEDVPTHCLTQGLGTILDARRLVLVATGPGKALAVAAAVEGPLTASCPASVLQWHPDAWVIVDEAAATGLRNRDYYAAVALGMPASRPVDDEGDATRPR